MHWKESTSRMNQKDQIWHCGETLQTHSLLMFLVKQRDEGSLLDVYTILYHVVQLVNHLHPQASWALILHILGADPASKRN